MIRKSDFGSAGFTLVELVVTLVVLAVLGAVSIPAYRSYVMRSRAVEAPMLISELVGLEIAYWNKPHVVKATGAANNPCFQVSSAQEGGAWGVYHPSRDLIELRGGPHPWEYPSAADIPGAFNNLGFRPSSLLSYTYSLQPGPILGLGAPYCYNGDNEGVAGVAAGNEQMNVRSVGDLDEDGTISRATREITLTGGSPRAGALYFSGDNF